MGNIKLKLTINNCDSNTESTYFGSKSHERTLQELPTKATKPNGTKKINDQTHDQWQIELDQQAGQRHVKQIHGVTASAEFAKSSTHCGWQERIPKFPTGRDQS